ncbi:unnamed protein product [Parascedosporium putredinis]|uniref:Glycosyltransferase family 31 protein n=1 Tax=Parascedosporium putredinis TaxID=1442378 RepID=A0A9P1GV65_9PEZI|nr:unnamed protein product [Parascedosporium putredinis]CAI7987676.1 unnamed protein product [Parascedosporium putredinis]
MRAYQSQFYSFLHSESAANEYKYIAPLVSFKVRINLGMPVIILVVFVLTRSPPETNPIPNIYSYTDNRPPRPITDLFHSKPSTEAAWLDELADKHVISKDVRYYSVRIKPHLNSSRPTMSDIESNFMHNGFRGQASIDASQILFGISSSYDRITRQDGAFILDWTRWLTDGNGSSNGASLILTLRLGTEHEVRTIKRSFRIPTRYFDLLEQLELGKSGSGFHNSGEKQYLALVDDDVFFPDMTHLVERLKKYNPEEEYYIGAPSERADWVADPDQTVTFGGDLRSLLFNYDLGIAPLALHQSRNRHLLDPGKATALHPHLNPATFLQRYRFADDWVLVNGHTLSHYPDGQGTAFLGSDAVFSPDFEARAAATLPLNSNLAVDDEGRDPHNWSVTTWSGSRRIWKFIDSRSDASNGEVWQAYVRRRGEPGEYTDNRRNEDKAGTDYVVVLIWESLPGGSDEN